MKKIYTYLFVTLAMISCRESESTKRELMLHGLHWSTAPFCGVEHDFEKVMSDKNFYLFFRNNSFGGVISVYTLTMIRQEQNVIIHFNEASPLMNISVNGVGYREGITFTTDSVQWNTIIKRSLPLLEGVKEFENFDNHGFDGEQFSLICDGRAINIHTGSNEKFTELSKFLMDSVINPYRPRKVIQ